MISVINKFEIDRNPSASADLSFFPMEISQNVESRVSSDPESRVPVNGDRFDSPSPDSASGSRVSESDELSLSSHGFKIGDMVWGKVKSHPWWPGHIYDESFASPSVRRTKHEGLVLVAFFGDSSYGWFDPAELIPYAPNFIEKSKQTTARSFVKAVEESVDESSRRAALGLSCMCRNPYNFRPMHVPGYFAVDVPGFERGGLYSAGQVERSREEFEPAEALAFLRRIALAPSHVEQKERKEIEVQKTAQLLALRKAWFEEFDETYAQAFGVQPVRPAQDKLEDEPEKFAPRVAPLSGPLVIAEALGDKKRKKKSYLTKPSSLSSSSSSKKNKYLLKRRDQVPIAAASSLPDAYFGQQQPKLKAPSLPSQTRQLPSSAKAEVHDFVLQKRDPEVPPDDRKPKPMSALPSEDTEMLPATEFPTPVLVDQKVVAESKQEPVGTHQPRNDGNSVDRKLKKEKVNKRPREDRDDKGEVIKKKKKKRKLEQLDQEITMRMENAQPEPVRTSDPNVPDVSTPELDLESLGPLELPELLADLSSLAMDPFHGVDRDAPSVVRHVFLKFRSLVYQKSLVLPAASEGDGQELQPSNPSSIAVAPPPPPPKEAKEKREVAPKVKLGSLFKRSLDPTKAGRKRTPSDRQEEMSAKRLKKLNQLKLLSSEKKAAIAQTTPQGEKESNLSAAAAVDSVRKPEKQEPLLPLPPKKESPTNLILKFPPRSTLPSVANLKARFARFGPIAVERCRVLWNTHSCRVQFKYKVDALEAYNYVKDNNLFGQIKVVYSVREVELPGSQSEQQRRLESQPGISSQFRSADGSGGLTAQPGPSYQRQHSGPLKSILKKPGDDAGKENQRVKFRLATDDSKSEPTPAALSVSFSNSQPSSLSASKSASVLPPLKPTTSLPPSSFPPPKSTTFLPPSSLPPPRSTTFPPSHPPPPRPMPAQPHASLPPRMFESQHLPPPSQLRLSQLPLPPPPPFRSVENRPPMTHYSESHLRQQVQQYGGGSSEGANTYTNVDISRKMLSLMNRCNEIVTSLQSLPGFVPFRPL